MVPGSMSTIGSSAISASSRVFSGASLKDCGTLSDQIQIEMMQSAVSRLNSSVYLAAGFGMASSFLIVSLHSKGFGFL